jgi:hypothetical protein
MAVFTQERHVELANDESEIYVITSTLVSYLVDELPHPDVFVVNIATREDAKDDTLARVATIADLTTLPRGRDAGLASASGVDILYVTNTWRLEYVSLDEGVAASDTVRERVNALILSWQTFDSEFDAPDPTPASYILPTSDLSELCARVEEYKVAKQDRYQKDLAATAADDTRTATNDDYLYKYGLVTNIDPLKLLGDSVSGSMDADKIAFDAANAASAIVQASYKVTRDSYLTSNIAAGVFYDAAVVYYTFYETGLPEDDTFDTAIAVFLAAHTIAEDAVVAATAAIDTYQIALDIALTNATAMAEHVTDAASLASGLTSTETSYKNARDTAATALATADATLITANQALAEALTLETTKLNAVLAISPDFDKYTIPLLDDVAP